MAEGIEVARALVTIVPTMEGSQAEMTKQITSAGNDAADKAGKSSGSKFTGSFGSSVKKGATVMAAAIGAAVAGTGAMAKGLYDAASATAAYGDNIDKAQIRAIGDASEAFGEMCKVDTRQLQTVVVMTADGFTVEKRSIGKIADTPEPEPAEEA